MSTENTFLTVPLLSDFVLYMKTKGGFAMQLIVLMILKVVYDVTLFAQRETKLFGIV